MGCPYFQIRVNDEVKFKDVYCTYSDRSIQEKVLMNTAIIISELMPNWCELPDEQINGIPVT